MVVNWKKGEHIGSPLQVIIMIVGADLRVCPPFTDALHYVGSFFWIIGKNSTRQNNRENMFKYKSRLSRLNSRAEIGMSLGEIIDGVDIVAVYRVDVARRQI